MPIKASILFRRILAQVIDLYVLGGVVTLAYLFAMPAGDMSHLTPFIWGGFLVYTLRDSILGVSLGRFLCGLHVTRRGQRAPFHLCFVRNLCMLLWPVELVMLLVTGRRLGDRLTGCVVAVGQTSLAKRTAVMVPLLFVSLVTLLFLAICNIFTMQPSYQTSLDYLRSDEQIRTETGGVTGFGWFTTGGIESHGDTGSATFHFKVFGKHKNVAVTLQLHKDTDGEWMVDKAEY